MNVVRQEEIIEFLKINNVNLASYETYKEIETKFGIKLYNVVRVMKHDYFIMRLVTSHYLTKSITSFLYEGELISYPKYD